MDVTTSVVLTAVVATVGRYTKDKKWPNIQFVVGSGAYYLFISGIESARPQLAKQIATLVLITTLLVYINSIVKKLHLDKAAKGAGLAK